jgi:DNA-binding YbaB/EbfC family protein
LLLAIFIFVISIKNNTPMFDMMKMMGKMKEVQAKMKEAQDNLVRVQATGDAGGGMVKATVNGKKQVISIDIDATILRTDDKILVQDLVVAAVNKANEEVEVLAKEELKKTTDGLLPNIPGIDLSSLMG